MVKFSNKIFILCFFLMTILPSVYAECLVTTDNEIASKIAHGHAWINHSVEFSAKKRIANIEMPETSNIITPEDFQTYILSIITTSTPNVIPGDRKVYWDQKSGTIIFYDPYSNDCGTAFRPNEGKEYYERVLKRKESDKDRSKKGDFNNQNTHAEIKMKSQMKENSRFQCDGRIHCSQMKSCEEATFFVNNCPNTKMDGNGDGIPCESQWCR